MMRLLVSMLCFMGSTTIVGAQPLYVGDKEIDTADHEALAAIIDHCEVLAGPPASDEAASTAAVPFSGGAVEPPVPEPNPDAFSAPLVPDVLASSGDSADAAGEGSGSGMPASSEDSDQQGSDPVLRELSLELCKEAGILF